MFSPNLKPETLNMKLATLNVLLQASCGFR